MARLSVLSKKVLPAFVCCLLLIGCGDSRDNNERLNDALALIDQKRFRAAEVDLKNILKAEPDNIAARIALGHAAYGRGDYSSAENAWQRARRLGADGDQYALPLVRALLQREAYVELLAEMYPDMVDEPPNPGIMLAYRARATLALGSKDEARQMFNTLADISQPPQVRHFALLGQAELAHTDGENTRAETLVRESLSLEPESTEAQLFLGQLLVLRRDFEEAEQVFERGLNELQPTTTERMLMMAGRVEALLGQSRTEEAQVAANQLEGVGIRHPMIGYLQGRVALQAGDADRMVEILEELVLVYPDFPPANRFLGASYLQRGEVERAEMLLAKVVLANPADRESRRLLARTRSMLNREALAAETLADGITGNAGDVQTVNMLARLAIRDGNSARAIEMLETAQAENPGDTEQALSLAAAYKSSGRVEDAIGVIERAIPSNTPDNAARKQILLLLIRHNFDAPEQSLPAIRQLRATQPENPALLAMTASLFDLAGSHDEARADLERVIQLEPDNAGAILRLGALDEKAGNFSTSKPYLLAYLKTHPNDEDVLLALSRILEIEGDYVGSSNYLANAHAAHPDALRPNLALAGRALLEDRVNDAHRFASTAVDKHPNSAQAHALLGRIELKRGNSAQGIVHFTQASAIDPDRAQWLYLRAQAELTAGRNEEARSSLLAALRKQSDYLPAMRELALLEIGKGDAAIVSRLVEELGIHQNRGKAMMAIGDIRAAQGRFDGAASAYAESYAIAPSRALAASYYEVAQRAGDDKADILLRRWLERVPGDAPARTFLADQLLRRGNTDEAIAQYERVLSFDSQNVNAMNNLAWLLFDRSNGRESTRSLALAEQAYLLAPNRPDIADTYGWILTESGQLAQGREVLEKALGNASPHSMPDVAYHLAVVLERSGKTDEARRMLERTLSESGDFYSRRDAQVLFERL